MISLSKRCQYALRALLELTARRDDGAISVNEIATAQAIPRRFLELIIKDLKQAGFVEAHRGAKGGYTLATAPESISVGQVIRALQGEFNLVSCQECGGEETCTLKEECGFINLWRRAQDAMTGVFDSTTLVDLLPRSRATIPTPPSPADPKPQA